MSMELEMNKTVEFEGKLYEVKIKKGLKTLKLYNLGIKDITELKGLDNLTDLQVLNLAGNQITEIKGLENLRSLERLLLYNNQITEIKGLENLTKLDYLTLWKNPVFKESKDMFGGTGANEQYKDPQAAVNYCQNAPKREEKVRKEREQKEREQREREVREAEQREQEQMDRKKKEKKVKIKAIESIKKLSIVYKEIKIDKISSKIGLDLEYIENLIEEMIINKEIEAEIDEDSLIFKKSIPKSKEERKISQHPKEFNEKTIKILRGGDWKIEGNQSVFYYKVKVENNSQFLIGNIQILLTSIPQGLKTQSQVYSIDFLKPGSFESPTFKLNATESCVGDTLEGLVSYTDPKGTQQTVNVEPFKISYVCNLLTPKLITREEFEEKIGFMEEKKLIIDSNLNITDLEQILENKIKQCNFALLQQIENSQREGFRKIEGFAQGLYDKEDVGISIAVKKMEEGSKLVIKAMSDRGEKITDLLKDFSIRLDDIKNDTELIKEYTSQIEEIFDKQVDLEAYLKSHLGSEWEKIKDSWQDYKTGKIDKKDLIYRGIKLLGRTFIRSVTRFI